MLLQTVSSHLSGGSLVRGFTCPEVQTRNPTQPRVREKVKARIRVRVRVRLGLGLGLGLG